MNYSKNTDSGNLETLLEQLKRKAISNKDYLGTYTKMVQSASFKDNNIRNVINYIPFVLDENGDPVVDETLIKGNAVYNDLSKNTINRITGIDTGNSDAGVNYPAEEIQLFEDDNTLSEIVNQKLVSFRRGKITPTLNLDSPLLQDASENAQQIVTNFATMAADVIDTNMDEIMRKITLSKYYPFAGTVFMPISYTNEAEDGTETRPNHRKIDVTPFTLDIDGTSEKLEDAEWAIVTEKVTYKEFRTRVKNGEFSNIMTNSQDSTIEAKWNRESSYQFASKSFLEQAITRNNDLRGKSFTSVKTDKSGNVKMEDFNLFGVIEYLWLKDYEGNWNISTFLNGNLIGKTSVDSSIDVLPVVLYSESGDIDNDLEFNGNLAFKLLAPQLTILDLNCKKKAASDTMAPLIANVFVQSDTEVDQAKENTEMVTSENKVSMLTVGVSNPQTANNTSRMLLGSQVYTTYLKEIDELIMGATATMRTKAGLTDFTQGTAAGSFNSQAGLDAMKVAGLEGEQDVVKAIEKALTKTAILEAYFRLIDLSHRQGKKKNETGLVNEYRTNLSTAIKGYGHLLNFGLETRYQEQFTQSILQTVVLPMSAQTGHLDVTLNLLKQLPITSDMKTSIDEAITTIQEKEAAAMEQQMKEQEQGPQTSATREGAPTGNGNASKDNKQEKTKESKSKSGEKANKDNKGGEAKSAKNQKSTNSKGNQNK